MIYSALGINYEMSIFTHQCLESVSICVMCTSYIRDLLEKNILGVSQLDLKQNKMVREALTICYFSQIWYYLTDRLIVICDMIKQNQSKVGDTQFWVFYIILNYTTWATYYWKPHQNRTCSSRDMSKCRFWKTMGNKRNCFQWAIIKSILLTNNWFSLIISHIFKNLSDSTLYKETWSPTQQPTHYSNASCK